MNQEQRDIVSGPEPEEWLSFPLLPHLMSLISRIVLERNYLTNHLLKINLQKLMAERIQIKVQTMVYNLLIIINQIINHLKDLTKHTGENRQSPPAPVPPKVPISPQPNFPQPPKCTNLFMSYQKDHPRASMEPRVHPIRTIKPVIQKDSIYGNWTPTQIKKQIRAEQDFIWKVLRQGYQEQPDPIPSQNLQIIDLKILTFPCQEALARRGPIAWLRKSSYPLHSFLNFWLTQ